MNISASSQGLGKSHFKALLKSFKNDLSSERPKPHQILNKMASNEVSQNKMQVQDSQILKINQQTNPQLQSDIHQKQIKEMIYEVGSPERILKKNGSAANNEQSSATSSAKKLVKQNASSPNLIGSIINQIQIKDQAQIPQNNSKLNTTNKTVKDRNSSNQSSQGNKRNMLKNMSMKQLTKGIFVNKESKSNQISATRKGIEERLHKYMHRDKVQQSSSKKELVESESEKKIKNKLVLDKIQKDHQIQELQFQQFQDQNQRQSKDQTNLQSPPQKQKISQRSSKDRQKQKSSRSPSFSKPFANDFSFDVHQADQLHHNQQDITSATTPVLNKSDSTHREQKKSQSPPQKTYAQYQPVKSLSPQQKKSGDISNNKIKRSQNQKLTKADSSNPIDELERLRKEIESLPYKKNQIQKTVLEPTPSTIIEDNIDDSQQLTNLELPYQDHSDARIATSQKHKNRVNSDFDLKNQLIKNKLVGTNFNQYNSQKNLKLKSSKHSYIRETESSLIRKRQNSTSIDNQSFIMTDQQLQKSIFDLFPNSTQNQYQNSMSTNLNSNFTFKPKVNEISSIIAKKKKEQLKQKYLNDNSQSETKPPRTHWDILYQHDIERKKQVEQRLQEQSLIKEVNELKPCTFRPQLYTSRNNKNSLFIQQQRNSTSNFYERNIQWLEQVDTKVKQERKKEKKEVVKDCTFKPNLKDSNQSFIKMSLLQEEPRGVDVFIRRLQEAQQKKIEEAEVFLLPSQKKEKAKAKKGKGLWREIEDELQESALDSQNEDVKTKNKSGTIQSKLKNVQHYGQALGLLKDELRAINFNRTNGSSSTLQDITLNYER